VPKIYYNLLYFLPQNMTGPIMTAHPVKIINLISFRVTNTGNHSPMQCPWQKNWNNFVVQYNARTGAEMEFVAKRLTSKDLVFPLSSSKYSPPSSHAVSCREALPAYISLIKSKERRDHTHPILSAGFSVRVSLLSFSFLPSFLSATRDWLSVCSTSYNTTRPLNRSRSPYVWQIIRDRDKDRRRCSLFLDVIQMYLGYILS